MRKISKKIILLVALLAATMTFGVKSAQAQSLYWGVRGGLNYSYVSDRANSDGLLGFNLGGFAGYQISPNIGVQIEGAYSSEGFKAGAFAPEGAAGEHIVLGYIKLPVMMKLYLIGGLNFEAGLSFNFLTTSLHNGAPLGGLNCFDLSIPLGLAYQIGRNAEVGVRWDISTLPINPKYSGANRALSLNFAWRF